MSESRGSVNVSIGHLQILSLSCDLLIPLTRFFGGILESGENRLFHPHAFTDEQARQLCKHSGLDCYVVLSDREQVYAYGMLRGWDEGFNIPSLGLYVGRAYRRLGFGTLLVLHLHAVAALRGSTQVRITVYKTNGTAVRLYEKLGYKFMHLDDQRLLGLVDLPTLRSATSS